MKKAWLIKESKGGLSARSLLICTYKRKRERSEEENNEKTKEKDSKKQKKRKEKRVRKVKEMGVI